MRAVMMTAAGEASVLQLHEIDEPVIERDTQIKVQLKAAGINPVDTKIRRRGLMVERPLPAILGCDGAGVVTEIGRAVKAFKPGDKVWFCNGGLGAEPGNYAEFTVLESSVARRMPRRLSFEQAAAAPLVLITAWEALYDRARLQPEQRVLIHAGAGGVGHVAIQLARLRGARVATTVGSAEKESFVYDLGAEKAILYKDTHFGEAVRAWTDGKGVDVCLDTVGGDTFRQSLLVMAEYGDLVTLLDPGSNLHTNEARNRNLRIGFELMLTPMLKDLPDARAHQGAILDECAKLIDRNQLTIHLGKTLTLAEAAKGHHMVEQGHMHGKVVLSME